MTKLLAKNEQMEQSLISLAQKVADSLGNLSQSFVPLLEAKERENQKLKRMLRERIGLKDDDILLQEIMPSKLVRCNELGASYKRPKVLN